MDESLNKVHCSTFKCRKDQISFKTQPGQVTKKTTHGWVLISIFVFQFSNMQIMSWSDDFHALRQVLKLDIF